MLPALLLALLAGPALADEPAPTTGDPAPIADEPAPIEPAPREHPTFAVGRVVLLPSQATLETEGLVLTTCAAAPLPPANDVQSGTLIFEVRLRRGKVSLVSVATETPGLGAYTPCLERVLTEYAWPIRSAKVQVPVSIAVR